MASERPPSDQHPLSADQPIMSAADDLLGRAPFAQAISRTVASWPGRETLVLAVYGSWGAGKSSVKNMVVERLGNSTDGPVVVEFSPWQWAGQNHLASGFFKEIEVALGKADPSKHGKRLAKKWELYGARLKVGGLAIEGMRGVVAALLIGVGVLVVLAGGTLGWLTTVAQALGAFLVLVGIGVAFSYKLATGISKMYSAEAEYLNRTIDEVRDEIMQDLGNLPRPVLVVIDDIDRLTADETRLLMQLVKANANFPNLIFLLLMDRNVAEKALTKDSVCGRDYLEKIVQVGFDLPVHDSDRFQDVLFKDLERALGQLGAEVRFDQEHWQQVYLSGLRDYFVSLRAVRRFTSALSFDLSLVQNDDVAEVNPVDLIAMVAIRVFEPDFYRALPGAKLLLTGVWSKSGIADPKNDEMKSELEALVSLVSSARAESTKKLLSALFPQVSWVFAETKSVVQDEERWYRDLRVCHYNVFDRYFQLAVPEGDLSQRDIDRVEALSDDLPALKAHFQQLQKQGLLGVLFDRLEAHKDTLHLVDLEKVVIAILDVGDVLFHNLDGRLEIDPSVHARRVIRGFVAQESDPAIRSTILKNAVGATEGFTLAMCLVGREAASIEARQNNPSRYVLDDHGADELQAIAVTRIEAAAVSGRLASSPRLRRILWFWRDWASDESAQDWSMSQTSTPASCLEFISRYFGEDFHPSIDRAAGMGLTPLLDDIENFIAESTLRDRVAAASGQELPGSRSVVLEALRAEFAARDQPTKDLDLD